MTFPASGKSVAFPTVPVRFSEYQVCGMEMPGAVGEDTDEVLQEYGYAQSEIDSMREAKAIL